MNTKIVHPVNEAKPIWYTMTLSQEEFSLLKALNQCAQFHEEEDERWSIELDVLLQGSSCDQPIMVKKELAEHITSWLDYDGNFDAEDSVLVESLASKIVPLGS